MKELGQTVRYKNDAISQMNNEDVNIHGANTDSQSFGFIRKFCAQAKVNKLNLGLRTVVYKQNCINRGVRGVSIRHAYKNVACS